MNKNKKASYIVHWVKTLEFPNREFPMVYMLNGEISYSLTSYLTNEYKAGRAKNSTSLYDLFKVVADLNHYFIVNEDKHDHWLNQPQQLIIDFFGARYHGTINNGNCHMGLAWEATSYESMKKLINAFKGYEKFCRNYLQTESMNIDDIISSHVSRYNSFSKHESFSLLSHLEPSISSEPNKKKIGETGTSYSYENNASIKRDNSEEYKSFPPQHLFDFIENTKDINYKAAKLLCAFCGLRISEALHIFITDIVHSNTSLFHEVILSEPYGKTWDHINDCKQKRVDVLDSYYNPNFFDEKLSEKELSFVRKPRPRVQEVGKYALGWKGITVSYKGDSRTKRNVGYTLEWSNDYARIEFERLLPELLGQKRTNHPYLLCKKNGTPMTYVQYLVHFKTKSLALTKDKLETHSLRHFTGFYLANVLKRSLEGAKVFLRHKSITSTDVYYNIMPDRVREELKQIKFENPWEKNLDFSTWGKGKC